MGFLRENDVIIATHKKGGIHSVYEIIATKTYPAVVRQVENLHVFSRYGGRTVIRNQNLRCGVHSENTIDQTMYTARSKQRFDDKREISAIHPLLSMRREH